MLSQCRTFSNAYPCHLCPEKGPVHDMERGTFFDAVASITTLPWARPRLAWRIMQFKVMPGPAMYIRVIPIDNPTPIFVQENVVRGDAGLETHGHW